MILDNILDLVFPPRCCVCGESGKYLCNRCILNLKCTEPECYICRNYSENYFSHSYCRKIFSPSNVFVIWEYNYTTKKLLQKFKYSGVYSITSFLGDLLVKEILKNRYLLNILRYSVIIPIPSHTKKLNERGFNQTELICRYFCKRLGLESASYYVKRVRYSDSQTKKDKYNREVYIKDTFRWDFLPDKPLVIFDDVFTTGSTVHTCIRDLRSQYQQVPVIVVLALFRSPHLVV